MGNLPPYLLTHILLLNEFCKTFLFYVGENT